MVSGPKVSVISIIQDDARFLKTAFKSFAYQDYKNMEWIMVNNASQDRSAALMQKYHARDERVKLYLNKTRKSVDELYNFAIGKATGDYITFLEPKTLWVKDKISRQVGFMIRYNAILSHTSYAFADDNCTLLPVGCCHIEQSVNLVNFRKSTDICLSTFMMNREEVKKFFPFVNKDEKSDLLMYLMQKGLVSQGMSDVLTLCRPEFNYPVRTGFVNSIKNMYKKMLDKNVRIPNLMRYEVYKAQNVTSIKTEPSMFIGKDVFTSLEELKNFKL